MGRTMDMVEVARYVTQSHLMYNLYRDLLCIFIIGWLPGIYIEVCSIWGTNNSQWWILSLIWRCIYNTYTSCMDRMWKKWLIKLFVTEISAKSHSRFENMYFTKKHLAIWKVYLCIHAMCVMTWSMSSHVLVKSLCCCAGRWAAGVEVCSCLWFQEHSEPGPENEEKEVRVSLCGSHGLSLRLDLNLSLSPPPLLSSLIMLSLFVFFSFLH